MIRNEGYFMIKWQGKLTTGQWPCQGHDEIPQVVWMTTQSPPARYKQTLSGSRWESLQIYKNIQTVKIVKHELEIEH